MNIKELKQLLDDYPEDMEVIFMDNYSLTPLHFNNLYTGNMIGGEETLILTDSENDKEFRERSRYLSGYTLK